MAQTNLEHHADVRFGSDYSQQHVAEVDQVGESMDPNTQFCLENAVNCECPQVGWDLCVLATSRHSVHTYGTFGMWGSLLAGGEAVVARGRVQVGTWSQWSEYSPMILLSAGRGADSGGHLVQPGRHAGVGLRGYGGKRGGWCHTPPGEYTYLE